MRIEIIPEHGNSEIREVYRFNMMDTQIVFVQYRRENKPKGKRLWRTADLWDVYEKRLSNIEEPNLPTEIRAKAHQCASKLLHVKTWSEWKGK